MIDLFFSTRSRSRAIGIFCISLAACAPATHYAGDGRAQSPDAPPMNPPASTTMITPAPASTIDQAPPPKVATQDDARPPLRSAVGLRSRSLLVTELQGLEQLAAQTPTSAPDHAPLLRRLAEDYVELEHVAQIEGATPIASTARNKAISDYARLVSEHPTYPRMDEALYYLAVEYEAAQDDAHARQIYLELIQRAPSSRFVPNAYLAFGEMYFDEAAQDPSKWNLALAAYQRVLRDPPPRNNVYGYAWYKLGWVLRNQGDRDGAIQAFNHAIAFANEYASAPGSSKLAHAARADIVSLGAPSESATDTRAL
jgi:tetratricopeptide (TPR) repeat protein